ncbi:MAG: acetyltransferase [Oscillospiraceae bacterium]|jgi:sugar O-acyltransferase (sialic acid O-acetyltransferase NeuD family)|nr:acetyltransferase [Oscillospiraceae bacterium]
MTLCIFGAGGHAVSVWDAARTQYDDIFFLAHTAPAVGGARLCGRPVFVGEDPLAPGVPPFDALFVAVGDNAARLALTKAVMARALHVPVLVHAAAYVSPLAQLGPGTCVLPQAAVNAGARLGAACVVNTGAVAEHECVLGDGVHLAPRAALGGGCVLGEGVWIGIGASVIQGTAIGAWSVVAAGAAVTRALPARCLAAGVPATVKKFYGET